MTKLNNKCGLYFLLITIFIVLISSCSTTELLEDNESLLHKNEVDIISYDGIEDKYSFKTNITNLIRQQPNGTFLKVPKEFIYTENSAPQDTLWYHRFFKNYLGEPPSILSEELTYETANDIKNYLSNQNGFYNASVSFDVDTIPDKTYVKYRALPEDRFMPGAPYVLDTVYTTRSKVTYKVEPRSRYKINSIEYLGGDTEVMDYLASIRSEAIVKPGDYIDAVLFDLELTRMSLALQNKGYANFATNYFKIQGDSSLNKNAVDIFLELMPPLPDSTHQVYTIGDINVYTDFHSDQVITKLDSDEYNGNRFFRQRDEFLVRPNSIDNSIFLKTGQTYNRDARTKTRKKLSELGTYRFVTLNAKVDEVNDSIINYDIMLTPFQKKWVADFGWDFFISSTSQSSNGSNEVLGVSLSNQLKNRNLLGGAEQFTLSTEVGLEVQYDGLSTNTTIRSGNVGLNGNLRIPKQVNLFGLAPLLRGTRLLRGQKYQTFKENTSTNIRGGVNYNILIENFSRSSINASFEYDYRPNKTSRYVIRQLGLEYNDYELSPEFEDRIEDNPLLVRSFDDNLLTGLFFRDITYIYTRPQSKSGNSFNFVTYFDLSGLEKYALNQAYNAVSGSSSEWTLTNNIQFAKYARLDIDPRFYKHFSDRHSLATRFFAGIIVPFGGSEAAPFFKQFSVGGPNSMRGWDQKELGPGAYSELLITPEPNQTFFQTGDIKLEANVEYRFDIYYVFEGAFFIDAGNVWTLKENADRPGSQFTSDFANQIAVSAGYGIRFDFDYFNIRFDFGYKLRNPYADPDTNKHWYTWEQVKNQKFGNFQVAVNYPF